MTDPAAARQVEFVKCVMSVIALMRVWNTDGVTEDNRLGTSWSELWVYPIPAALYLVKNLMQVRCYVFLHFIPYFY